MAADDAAAAGPWPLSGLAPKLLTLVIVKQGERLLLGKKKRG